MIGSMDSELSSVTFHMVTGDSLVISRSWFASHLVHYE